MFIPLHSYNLWFHVSHIAIILLFPHVYFIAQVQYHVYTTPMLPSLLSCPVIRQLFFYLHMFTLLNKCNKMFIQFLCYHLWFHVQLYGNNTFIYTSLLYCTCAIKCLTTPMLPSLVSCPVIWQLFFY